jgi:hypothetical protein
MKRVLGVGWVALVSFVGCSTMRLDQIHGFQDSLTASMEPMAPQAMVGTTYPVRFTLHNGGAVTISGCFGGAFEVTFIDGKQDLGFVTTVDHPDCEQRFELLPGASIGRIYNARVPNIAPGQAKLRGYVQVVSLLGCDRYGCNAVNIPVFEQPEV